MHKYKSTTHYFPNFLALSLVSLATGLLNKKLTIYEYEAAVAELCSRTVAATATVDSSNTATVAILLLRNAHQYQNRNTARNIDPATNQTDR